MSGIWIMLSLFLTTGSVKSQSSSKCHCYISDQNKFCKAQFVMEVIIEDTLIDRDTNVITYLFKPVTVYKPDKKKSTDYKEYNLVTSAEDPECEVKLIQKKTYIVSGMVKGKELKLSTCDSIVLETGAMTKVQQDNLVKGFFNCQCKVDLCKYDEDCQNFKNNNNCVTNFWFYKCKNQYSQCMKKDGVCQWHDDDEIEKCDFPIIN